jgi:hypothetical protein
MNNRYYRDDPVRMIRRAMCLALLFMGVLASHPAGAAPPCAENVLIAARPVEKLIAR